jgi:peptidyl-prolyl cis-trans isomerase SurA
MRWMLSAGVVALALSMSQPAFAQAAGQPTQPPAGTGAVPDFAMAEGVMVTVNDDLITSYDVRQRMLFLIFTSQLRPTEENLPAIQQQALRGLIDQQLQSQELERYEVEVTDEMVNSEIAAMAQESGASAEQMLAAMTEFGLDAATFREKVRVDMGWGMLVNGRYRDRTRVGTDQINAVLERIEQAASRPQWLLGEIYIDAAAVGGMDIAMNGARQLVQQLLQGAPFPAVARQFSSAPSAQGGGDAGWVIEGETPAQVQAALNQMNPGQLSNPIAVDGGVYIILVRDERTGAVSTMASLRQAGVRLPPNASEAQVAEATATLNALRDSGLTCDNIVDRANATTGVIGSELGEADVADLAAPFQEIARSAAVGSVSTPQRSEQGLHLVAMCGRRAASDSIPTREEVQQQLSRQQLDMLNRRYIRDLRNAATIESRGSES